LIAKLRRTYRGRAILEGAMFGRHGGFNLRGCRAPRTHAHPCLVDGDDPTRHRAKLLWRVLRAPLRCRGNAAATVFVRGRPVVPAPY